MQSSHLDLAGMSSNPNLNFTHSKCRLRRIKKVQFGVFSPDAIVSIMDNENRYQNLVTNTLLSCRTADFDNFYPEKLLPPHINIVIAVYQLLSLEFTSEKGICDTENPFEQLYGRNSSWDNES